jgi:RNA polymerase sigma factor (sigma-70 family)
MEESTTRQWFLEVLERNERALVRYAAKLTGNLEQGQELVQETFLKLLEDPAAAPRDHIIPWLFTVCRNKAFDAKRKEKRMVTGPACDKIPDERQELASQGIEKREEQNQMLGLLQTLPANQREVIRLKFQNGMSYKEISQVTGLSVSNVGFLMHTGLKQMRSAYLQKPGSQTVKGGAQ